MDAKRLSLKATLRQPEKAVGYGRYLGFSDDFAEFCRRPIGKTFAH